MMISISHFTWQVVRAAKRSKKPILGRELRVSPTRQSKDGTFLDDLVADGLLEVASVDKLEKGAPPSEMEAPVQFRTRYKLTAKGEHAAEYGECERAPRSQSK